MESLHCETLSIVRQHVAERLVETQKEHALADFGKPQAIKATPKTRQQTIPVIINLFFIR